MKLLENRTSKADQKFVTVQDEIIRCEECEFPAEDIHELVDHMYGSHPLESESEIECYHCGESFAEKNIFNETQKTCTYRKS